MLSQSFLFITGSTQHLWTEIYWNRSQFIATSILKSAVKLHIKNGIVFFRNRNSSKFSDFKLERFFLNISEAVENNLSTAAELGIGVLYFSKSFIHSLRCVDGNNSSSSGELRHSFGIMYPILAPCGLIPGPPCFQECRSQTSINWKNKRVY